MCIRDSTPIFVTQPYMYIANNYDNFNCLVEQLGSHSMGLRMLFPVWALTGLKFLNPSLVSFPIFVTKEELTTVTLIYDAYYDFGVLGILLFGLLAGAACALLYRLRWRARNPVCHVIYAPVSYTHLALMVIERAASLKEIERTGIEVNGLVSSQLLINIFEKNTPLHDGAVIVQGNRVTYATC